MTPSPARSSSLSTSSSSTIPSKSSHTSIFLLSPSPKPDENSLPTPAAPEPMNGPPSGRWSPRTSNKRKRASEPRSPNGGSQQLREAQEKVELKRAKIAARVPSAMAAGNARPASAPITALADLYAQLRRDSGAPGQQPASSVVVVPSPKTVPVSGRVLDSRTQNNAPRDRSTASSPDPIAIISEDDHEIMVLKHTQSTPQVRASFKPDAQPSPHLDLRSISLSKPKTGTLTPKSIAADSVDKLLDRPRKPKLSFAVVVPSPPKRSSHQSTRPSGQGTPQSRDLTPARNPAPKHVEKLKEETNEKASDRFATHTPPPARPARPLETTRNSTPEHGTRRARRGVGLSEDLTSRDIDILLDAVPVPFDFSLARHHLAPSREDGESDGKSDESSLWWYHPIFEARAKADIHRTLSKLLPGDPAQDPPSPVGGVGGWRAEVRPRQSRARIWAERLEDAFGPGPLDRGLGRKPRRVARPAGAAKGEASDSWRPRNGTGRVVVIANSHRSVPHRILEPPSRRRSPKDAADVAFRPPDAVFVASSAEAANESMSQSEAAAWTAALLPLVKGKTTMDKAKMVQISDTMGEVERANQRGSISREELKESALADTVRRLSELDGLPFGDVNSLRERARTLTEQWRAAFGDGVVDLQHGVLLRVSY